VHSAERCRRVTSMRTRSAGHPKGGKRSRKGEEKIDEVKDLILLPSRSWGHRGQSVAPWTQARSRIRA
jgi:hypothetical protein